MGEEVQGPRPQAGVRLHTILPLGPSRELLWAEVAKTGPDIASIRLTGTPDSSGVQQMYLVLQRWMIDRVGRVTSV